VGFCGLDDLIVTQPAVSLLNGSHNTSLNRFAICQYFSTHLTISCHVLFVQLVTFVYCTHTHTHPFIGPFSGTTQVSRYQKCGVKPIWILLKQETVSGSGISRAICKSAPCSRQITTPAPYHSFFYRPDALPAAQPTTSKH